MAYLDRSPSLQLFGEAMGRNKGYAILFMTTALQAELVEEHEQPSNAIALRPSMSVEQAMSVQDIVAQVKLVQEVMRSVMKEGEHFGVIPGCGTKKNLLLPGAQKLTMTFRLAPKYDIQETNLERGHKEYRVTCTLKNMLSGSFVGQGVGCCSSMESKYRWRGGSRKCPECGKEAIIKGKAEYGGGWLCFAKKGGCGAKWPDGDMLIEGQPIERVENPDPADTFNTVLKMAKKRAFVDATITATAASDIFTQDLDPSDEEPPHNAPEATNPSPTPSKRPTGPSSVQRERITEASAPTNQAGIGDDNLPFESATPAAPAKAKATPEQKAKMLTELKANPGEENVEIVTEYFAAVGWLLKPGETLADLDLRYVPVTAKQMRDLGAAIGAFSNGEQAKAPYPPNDAEPPKEAPKAQSATSLEGPNESGVIQTVTLKEGKSAKGPWSLWGIKVNDQWHNTFNNNCGKAAQKAKGKPATVYYEDDGKGRKVTTLFIDGEQVAE